MNVSGWGQLLFACAVTAVLAPLLGRYLAATFSGEAAPGDRIFRPAERLVYWALRADPENSMTCGRFVPIILALAIAGFLAGARVHARTRATLDTAGLTFAGFLAGVIVIVGGLIYFPVLILRPIGERIIDSCLRSGDRRGRALRRARP